VGDRILYRTSKLAATALALGLIAGCGRRNNESAADSAAVAAAESSAANAQSAPEEVPAPVAPITEPMKRIPKPSTTTSTVTTTTTTKSRTTKAGSADQTPMYDSVRKPVGTIDEKGKVTPIKKDTLK
jgi:hypothetical protein